MILHVTVAQAFVTEMSPQESVEFFSRRPDFVQDRVHFQVFDVALFESADHLEPDCFGFFRHHKRMRETFFAGSVLFVDAGGAGMTAADGNRLTVQMAMDLFSCSSLSHPPCVRTE